MKRGTVSDVRRVVDVEWTVIKSPFRLYRNCRKQYAQREKARASAANDGKW